jgi:hypothetical protein
MAQNKQGNETPYEMKEGQLMVFKNTKKEDGSRQPDYWGKTLIGGVEKRVSLWLETSQSGNSYMSGRISDYEPKEAESTPTSGQAEAPF